MDKTIVADKLRTLRKRKKMTVTDFAKAIGISQSAVSMYESGIRMPRDDIKIKIAKFYHTTVQTIFFTN